jgi:lysophospholipase L1-like esterase
MPIEDTTNSYEYKLKKAGLAEPLSTYLSDPNDPDRLAAGFVGVKTNAVTGESILVTSSGTTPMSPTGPQTLVIAGDSLGANAYVTVGSNFANYAAEGYFNHLNAALGTPFRVIGSTAVGGSFATHFRDTQVPAILAMSERPAYVFVNTGVNDIYSNGKTAAETVGALISGLNTLFNNGITPIFTTILARSFSSTALFDTHKNANELIRLYWQKTRRGLFFDGFAITVDPDAPVGAQNIRSGWTYDSAPSLHPNNVGAYWIGKYAAAQIRPQLLLPSILGSGAVDYNTSADVGQLLSNPMFTGSAGVNGAGITGTNAPTGWSVQRTAGTPSATLAIVPITDPTTGLKIANAIQLTITANAAGDEIQIVNTASIHTRMAAGRTYEAECGLGVASPVNVDRVRFRVQADSGSGEGAWWGSNSQTSGNYPETFTYPGVRTRQITSIGTPVSGAFDARIKFSAAGSAVFTVWLPKVRSVQA